MTTPPSTTATQRPSAALAAGAALLNVILAAVLFNLAEAGPAAGVVAPLFPLVSGGFAVLAARHAVRAWRVTKASSGGAGRGVLLTLAFLALLTDVVVIAFAAFMGLLVLTGPMVR